MADLKHSEGDAVSARKLNGVVDRLPSDQFGESAGVGLLNPNLIRFRNGGSPRSLGDVVTVAAWDGVPDDPVEAKSAAAVTVQDPTWHSDICRLGIIQNSIGADDYGFLALNGLAVANFSSLNTGLQFAQVDPSDTSKLKSATGGPCRLLAELSGTPAVGLVELGTPQNFWRYLLNENWLAGGTNSQLLEMDGAPFSSSITLLDPLAFMDDQEAGDPGVCLQVGNSFYAVQAPCKEPPP